MQDGERRRKRGLPKNRWISPIFQLLTKRKNENKLIAETGDVSKK